MDWFLYDTDLRHERVETVTVILWKSDQPIAIAQELWKILYELVHKRSTQVGFAGFVQEFATLIKLFLDRWNDEGYYYLRQINYHDIILP